MPIFDLDTDLKPVAYRYRRKADSVYDRTVPPDAKERMLDWRTREVVPARETMVHATFTDEDIGPDGMAHANYTEYLCQAFAEHRSIVLTPDILWHTVLAEIAAQVVKTPKIYETLFTTTPDAKQAIVLPSGDNPAYFPMKDLMAALAARVPSDVSTFLPDFSTTTPMARFARWTNFAETCSPYYSYGTMACGYPRIDVQGEVADYERIIDCATALTATFLGVGDKVLSGYLFDKIVPVVTQIITAIKDADSTFFKGILSTQRCGSGGEIEVDGWWPQQMFVKSFARSKPENLPTHLARMTFKNLDTDREFSINAGLMYSTVDDGFSVPHWGWVKNEILSDAAFAAAKAALPVPQPLKDGELPFSIKKVSVKAESRALDAKWSISHDQQEMLIHPPEDGVIDEIAGLLVAEMAQEAQDKEPKVLKQLGFKVVEGGAYYYAPYIPGALLKEVSPNQDAIVAPHETGAVLDEVAKAKK